MREPEFKLSSRVGSRVLVQIPCLNEEKDIRTVIEAIPRKSLNGATLDILIIDDSSNDKTIEIARQLEVDLIIQKSRTRGLADSFKLGQAFFLAHDYDILVNTDGDNQYFQEKIPDLIKPILDGNADVVIGDRNTSNLGHFGWGKKVMQRLGSRVVSYAAGAKIPDAASGFRAYSRMAVSKLFITTKFSYAMESIIQAGNKGLPIISVETGARKVSRPSRLFRSSFEHVRRSAVAILKSFLMYKPVQIFSGLSLVLFLSGAFPMVRYLFLVYTGVAGDHLQSLILGSLLITASFLSLVMGMIAELSRIHRELFEEERAIQRLAKPLQLDTILTNFSASIIYPNKPKTNI